MGFRWTGAAVAVVLTAGLAGIPEAGASPASCRSSVPYAAGDAGYHTFRIPAVVETKRGTLLAFAEGRHDSAGDTGAIDTVLRRSSDGGCHWGPLSVVTTSKTGGTAGNPSPVVTANGRVVLLTTHNGPEATESVIMSGQASDAETRRVHVQYSDNDGRDFSATRDITADTKAADWRWYATGPGHAIVLRSGRIVVPANHSSAPPAGSADVGTEKKYYGGHAIYSDDGGRNWRIGFTDSEPDGRVNANESTAAELPDGTVYFNARDQGGSEPGNRVDAYSRDGGRSLTAPYTGRPALAGPQVQGSVLQTSRPDVLLFSGPSSPDSRAAMRVRVSADGGRSWRDGHPVSPAPAAYSDLVQLDRRNLGLLYETGDAGPYEKIVFHRLALAEVAG